jgi:hypothetical protein
MELQAVDDDIPEYIDASSKCLCCQGFVYECEGEICSRLGVCDCFADKEYAGDESTSPIATFTNSTVNPEESLMLEAFQASIAALLVPGFVSSGTGNDQLSLLAAMQQQVHYHHQQQQQQQQQQQSGGFFVGHRGGYRGSRGGFGRGVRGVVNNRGGRRGEYNSYQQPMEQNQRVSNPEDPWVTGASQKYTHIHRSGEPLQEIWPGITEQTPLSLSSSTTIQQRGLSTELATHGEKSEKDLFSHGISSSRTKMADREQISAPKTASEILASKVSGGVDESKVLVQRGPIGAVFLEDKDKIIEKKTSRRRNKNKLGEVGLETSTSLIVNNDNLEMERKRIPTALVEEGGSDTKAVKSVLNSLVNLSVSSSVSLPVIELNEEQRLKKDLRNAEKRLRSALDLQSCTSTLDVAQKEKVLQIPEIELIVKDLKGKLLALEVYVPS